MSVAFIVLSRGMTLTKEQWRRPGLRRTLERLDAAPVVDALYRGLALCDMPVVCAVELEGTAILRQSMGPLKRHHGMFEIALREDGATKLTLREEACSRLYGTPRRHTQTIATLTPWRTVRVLINGRLSSYSGQTYHVHEYYWTLCTPEAPERRADMLTVNLQADLS